MSFKILKLLPHVDWTYPCGRQCRGWKMLERYNSLWRRMWCLSLVGPSQHLDFTAGLLNGIDIVHLNCPGFGPLELSEHNTRLTIIYGRLGLHPKKILEFLQPSHCGLTPCVFELRESPNWASLRPGLHPDPKQKAGNSVALCTADKRTCSCLSGMPCKYL